MRIVGEIPARLGSKRVKAKNLRLLDGKPLIEYAISAAKQATTLTEVYVNSESDVIGEIALRNGIKYYKRPQELGGDTATQDEFNYDFIKAVKPDVLVMVNPVAPLIDGQDIDNAVRYFLDNGLDTLVTVREEQAQALYRGAPINFDTNGLLPRTQDLSPIQLCAWSVCAWRAVTFVEHYEKHGHAAFSGRVGFFPMGRFKSLKISTEEDFVLADILVRNMHRWKFPAVPYDSEVVDPSYPAMWLREIRCIEELLEEQAKKNDRLRVLEWGAGRSTIYFSNLLKRRGIAFTWLAIENYIPWYGDVVRMIEANQLGETTTCVVKSGTCEERKYLQETFDMTEYVNYPQRLGTKFDFVLVDGRRRRQCLEMAAKIVAPTGVVVLHDAERPDYHAAFVHYEDGGKFVCEQRSPVPGGVQRLWVGRLPRPGVEASDRQGGD